MNIPLNTIMAMVIVYQTGAASSRPIENAEAYFPTKVGDHWVYRNLEKGYEWSVKVVGAKTVEGHTYFVFERSFQKSTYRDTSYYRVEGSKVLVHYFGQDYLLVDFSIDSVESWNSYGLIKGTMLRSGSAVSAPAGSFENVYEVRFEIPGSPGSQRICKYAPGVGMVEYLATGGGSKLIYATVNGRELLSSELTSFSDETN